MDLTSAFTDDQLAVMGCFAALAVCGLIGMISFHFGPQGKQAQNTTSIKMPERKSVSQTDSRKAA